MCWRWLLAFCCSLACLPAAYSFQLADGSPAAPKAPARYIFYWDRLQCVLEEANGFKGSLKTTPQGFRSLLLSAPSIWKVLFMATHVSPNCLRHV